MAEPINAYTYYYDTHYAKNKVFEEIPWNPYEDELANIIDKEDKNCMLFYIPSNYKKVILHLKNMGRLVDCFECKSYGVAVIKPSNIYKGKSLKVLNYKDFKLQNPIGENKAIALWGGDIQSEPMHLTAGKYSVRVESWGSPVNGIYPINSIHFNNQKIAEFLSVERITNQTFFFTLKTDTSYTMKVTLENDQILNKEDRNTFIKTMSIYKQ